MTAVAQLIARNRFKVSNVKGKTYIVNTYPGSNLIYITDLHYRRVRGHVIESIIREAIKNV